MDWYEVKFPQEISPLAEPGPLIKEAQEIYEKAGCPDSFTVLQEIKSDGNLFLYFSPAARRHCAELFGSYRGVPRGEPAWSGKPIIWVAGDTSVQFVSLCD